MLQTLNIWNPENPEPGSRQSSCHLPAAAGVFVAAVANDSDIADLIAALKPGSVVAADGLYAGMADILPEVSGQPQVCSRSQHLSLGV